MKKGFKVEKALVLTGPNQKPLTITVSDFVNQTLNGKHFPLLTTTLKDNNAKSYTFALLRAMGFAEDDIIPPAQRALSRKLKDNFMSK